LKPLTWYSGLSDPRIRREQGCFMVEGRRAIEQILGLAPKSVDEILVDEAVADSSALKKYSCPVRKLAERQFKSVCTSKTPQGIAAVVRIPEGSYESGLPKTAGERILLLEGVQDPGNVGALARTAAAFDYTGIVLSNECADPYSPKAVQASAGSVLAVWIRRTAGYRNLAQALKAKGYSLIATDTGGEPIVPGRPIPRRHVIMLGSEGNGLTEELLGMADKKVRIPINDKKAESLNVAVSGAIVMWAGMNR